MTNTQTTKQTLPWFRQWFDSIYYHKLYANRNEEEAKTFIDALLKKLKPWNDSSIIDVGCGAGRHAKYLASKGFNVTGIDTAYSSIQQANEFSSASLRFIQHDMRIPFGINCFDYVFNFFTSFGYFSNNYENYEVIENMAKALKPHGALVIDYLMCHMLKSI